MKETGIGAKTDRKATRKGTDRGPGPRGPGDPHPVAESNGLKRGRPNHKNDNPRVEQKNWTHVRRVVGYRRLETGAELRQLRKVYRVPGTLTNLFETNARLESKQRDGAKVKRRMGTPRTPLGRLVDHHRDLGEALPERVRELLDLRAKLDPFELHEQLREAVDDLHNLGWLTA